MKTPELKIKSCQSGGAKKWIRSKRKEWGKMNDGF